MPPNFFTTVDAFDSVHQANLAVAILAQNGIDSTTENETLIANDWFLSGAVGGVKIVVPTEDAARAREVLEEWRRNRNERISAGKDRWIVFRCSNCKERIAIGAEHAGRVENCPRCRRYVDVPEESDPNLSEAECDSVLAAQNQGEGRSVGNPVRASWFLIIEVFVVLGFAYIPYQYWAIQSWYRSMDGGSEYQGFLSLDDNRALITQSVMVIVSTLAVLFVHGSLKPHGITMERAGRDTVQGIAFGTFLFFSQFLILQWLVPDEGTSVPQALPPAGVEGWIAILLSGLAGLILNSIAEELVMRGYLFVRIEQLTRSVYLAVAIPAILFAGYHIYQGAYGAISALIAGLILGVWFCKTRRLMGPVVAHTTFNMFIFLQELLGV